MFCGLMPLCFSPVAQAQRRSALGYPLLALFGTDYVAGYGALAVLGVGLLARASVGHAGDLLIVLGHQRDGLFIAILSLGMNVVLAVVLVPIFGILGAAISTACSQVVCAATLAYFVRRRAKLETLVFKCDRHTARSDLQASSPT